MFILVSTKISVNKKIKKARNVRPSVISMFLRRTGVIPFERGCAVLLFAFMTRISFSSGMLIKPTKDK